ncbi:hypothetical protein ACOME3_000829 [Neoechinorhynchus agilis]
MDSELAAKLNRRLEICGEQIPASLCSDQCDDQDQLKKRRAFSIYHLYSEFRDFTTQAIKKYLAVFREYDLNHDNVLDVNELRIMMEKLGAAQTHLALKEMIRQVDEDKDGKVSFREFLLIFRKVRAEYAEQKTTNADKGDTLCALRVLYEQIHEIDVSQHGVKAAADFFDKKVAFMTGVSGDEDIDSNLKMIDGHRGQRRAQFNEIRKKFAAAGCDNEQGHR